MARTLLAFFFLAAFTQAHACSCFGPNTFCGVLNPPYENPEWWLPDAVVMAVPSKRPVLAMGFKFILHSFLSKFSGCR